MCLGVPSLHYPSHSKWLICLAFDNSHHPVLKIVLVSALDIVTQLALKITIQVVLL